ncbi:MAG: hypothetical protein H0V64_00795 [Geodermatophilaceae bacterium]|nr:hypothetical protein [Geodermatophilaceae bacterium]
MGPGRRRTTGWSCTALAGVVLMTVGCAEGAVVVPGDVGPERPSAAGVDVALELAKPAAPWVLDGPVDGWTVDAAAWVDGYECASGPGPALYGDPAVADTLDGRTLLVSSSSGSAAIGGPSRRDADESVRVGGYDGWLVHERGRTWVGWEPGPDTVHFVGGRGLTDNEVIAAAQGAILDGTAASIEPDAVPDGLELMLAAGTSDGPRFCGSGGESIRLRNGESDLVVVSVVRADPRLSALWGWWIDDATGTDVRGHPGSVGTLRGSIPTGSAQVWAEDDVVVSVVGAAADVVSQVVAVLRPGNEAEFAAMQDALISPYPTARDVGCPDESAVVSALDVDEAGAPLRWAVALGMSPDDATSDSTACTVFIRPSGRAGGVSESVALRGPEQLSITAALSGSSPRGKLVVGLAPIGAARVVISGAAGTREAVLLDASSGAAVDRPGQPVFGQWFPGADSPPSTYTYTAYDTAGAILDVQEF